MAEIMNLLEAGSSSLKAVKPAPDICLFNMPFVSNLF